ncbi:hypothetical protein [Natronoglomus mannanivorans]|uniref:Uncharacterized protein n=1 Tax=Natronoglomus mannanivorans TaxID=2979990 RepID=A0AAP2YX69_9EURY|nr:hypothetical protein [Halobacteria archaeon AArc-xg1-1]
MTTPPFVTERELARTFDGGSYVDAWEAVEQYRKAMKYASRKNVKSGATASALDLPRSRLRTWIDDGGKPDSVRAIEIAHSYEWIECTYDDRAFTALNALVANIFSGGSIAQENYRPLFAVNKRGEDSHIFDALELANVEYDVDREHERERATEVRLSTDGAVLGRVLSVLGAPVGPKAHQRLELPAYLENAPDDVKSLFVACYLENRAVEYEGKRTLRVMEDRNRSYLEDLAALIEEVADESVSVDNRGITISAAAARNLGTVR